MKRKLKQIALSAAAAVLLFSGLSVPVHAESEALSQTSEETAPSGIKLAELSNEVDACMEKYIGVSSPGAVVVIVKNGEIILSRAYGMADTENNVPVNTDTVFEYASVSKMFVWVSVMQLAEQGKLDLDKDIRTYLPAGFSEKWKTNYPVTMRNIMNHSAGYGEYLFNLASEDESDSADLADAVLKTYPDQYFEPGTASSYSNYAAALAAYVIECITGKEFYQYEKENIFDKLNMNLTAGHPYWKDNPAILDNKAQGYTKQRNGQFANTGWSHVGQYPSGSVNGTGEDLAEFLMALMPAPGSDSPLFENNETINIMLSSSFSQGESGTAHGFFKYNSTSDQAYGHAGNSFSFSAQAVFVPSERFGAVILTNASGEQDITYGLHDLLIGSKKAVPSESGPELPDANLFSGYYTDMRRPEKTAHEFSSYLLLTEVKAIGTNRIQLKKGPFSAEYIQTSPYVFELAESESPVMRTIYYRLEFKTENMVPSQILIGNGLDLSALPAHRTPVRLALSAAVIIISVLFFAVCPIVLLISSIKRKRTNTVSDKKNVYVFNALVLSGTALLINNGILILPKLMSFFTRSSQINPLITANYILAAISSVLLITGLFSLSKQPSKTKKIWFAAAAAVLISFISVLASWNMFTLYG